MNCQTASQQEKKCEACILGKMQKGSVPKQSEKRATEPLEIVHSDVCGPMQDKSKGGSRYMLTFIDDQSRYANVYSIHSKSEVLLKFEENVSYVKKQFGLKVKTLRSDIGGKYLTNDFIMFCNQEGREYTCPYSPEQNGVAERLNCTVPESTRSMLFHWISGQRPVTLRYISITEDPLHY